MKAVVQYYIDTTEEWKTANPILYEAVWGIEITNKTDANGKPIRLLKLGNGKDPWQSLPYFDASYIAGLPEELAAIKQDIQNNVEALQREVQQRQDADQGLADAIAEEARQRQNADAAEKQQRQDADEALQWNIDAETRERKDTDRVLRNSIEIEAQNRRDGDALLDLLKAPLDSPHFTGIPTTPHPDFSVPNQIADVLSITHITELLFATALRGARITHTSRSARMPTFRVTHGGKVRGVHRND